MIKAFCFWVLSVISATAATLTPATPPAVISPHQPDYFFTIDIDPRYQLFGIGALTEEDAAAANCYRFAYDSDGNIQQIQYRRAGVPRPDPLLGVAEIDFERQPGLERRWFRDGRGVPSRNIFGIEGEELALNGAGFPTTITNIDHTGAKMRDSAGIITYVRTLDNLNRLIAGRRLGLLGTNITDDDGYFETRAVYDLQGRAIERGNYDASGNLLNNRDGVALVRTTYTLSPDSTLLIESYFDASGLPTEEKSTGVHQRQRTLDSRGFLVDEAYFDSTGAPTATTNDNIHERRYTYDSRGNEISEEYFDSDSKPVNFRNAGYYAKVVYQYDDKNRVVEKEFFGDDGAPQVPIELGAAVIRQDYDGDGNIVRRQFFDGQGHPSIHARYGAAAIRIRVAGDTTFVELRNENDRPTKNPVKGYYAFSYKTDSDSPLTPHNKYYDRHGHRMTLVRVDIINPHLHALASAPTMMWSARLGIGAAGLGAFLGFLLALRKSLHTKRRRVYIPSPLLRFLGWLSIFAIFEGLLRFVITIYWAWVGYQNGRMGNGIFVLEALFIAFFLFRLYRLNVTMRVLNIAPDDLHRLLREFFAARNLKAEWIASRKRYVTPPLDVRANFFAGKNHGYLAFTPRGPEGRALETDLAGYIRWECRQLQAPQRTRALALYYPSVAFCYLLMAGLALYTLAQLIIGF